MPISWYNQLILPADWLIGLFLGTPKKGSNMNFEILLGISRIKFFLIVRNFDFGSDFDFLKTRI